MLSTFRLFHSWFAVLFFFVIVFFFCLFGKWVFSLMTIFSYIFMYKCITLNLIFLPILHILVPSERSS